MIKTQWDHNDPRAKLAAGKVMEDKKGWWALLPDGKCFGPFQTEEEALKELKKRVSVN